MAAHVALEETGVPYEGIPVNLRKGEQHAEPFKQINPRAEVPVLKVGDETITQSVAILAYIGRELPFDLGLDLLCRRFAIPPNGAPRTIRCGRSCARIC
jgi:hypothetical protein